MSRVETKILFILFVILSIGQSSYAQRIAQKRYSLSQAIEKTLEVNYDIQIANQEIFRAESNRRVGVPDGRPQIEFKLNQANRFSRDNNPTSFTDGDYTKNEISGSLDTDWLLIGGKRVKIAKEKLRQIEEQQKSKSRLVIEEALKATILSYYECVIEREKEKVLKETEAFARDKYSNALKEYTVENISEFDLINYKNDLLSDSILLVDQRKKYNKALIRLKRLLNEGHSSNLLLTDELNFEEESFQYDELESQLLENNSNIKNEEYVVALLDNERKQRIAEAKPTLRFRNSISDELSTSQFSSETRENGGVLDLYASLSFSYNLYDGGSRKRRIQDATVNKIIAEQKKEDLISKVKELLQLNIEEYNRQVEILAMKQDLEASLDKNLKIAENRLTNGYSIFIEYRDAKLELSKARMEILETLYELKITEVEIIQLVGGLVQ